MEVKGFWSGKVLRRTRCGLTLVSVIAAIFILQYAETMKAQEITDAIVFDEFKTWTLRHLNGDFSDAGEHLQTGEKLAVERRRLLENLIANNPAEALERAIPVETADRLPTSIRQNLEKHFSSEGDYIVSVFDESNDSTGKTANHRIKREVVVNKKRYEAFVYGKKAEMTTKQNTPLRGIVLGEAAAVAEESAREINSSKGGNTISAENGWKIFNFENRRSFDDYTRNLTAFWN